MIIPAGTPEHPTVLFMPGLTGDSQSEYIKSFINIAKKDKNARCVVFIYRGLGGHVLKTPRAYCATDYQDVTRVVAVVANVKLTGVLMRNLSAVTGFAGADILAECLAHIDIGAPVETGKEKW